MSKRLRNECMCLASNFKDLKSDFLISGAGVFHLSLSLSVSLCLFLSRLIAYVFPQKAHPNFLCLQLAEQKG